MHALLAMFLLLATSCEKETGRGQAQLKKTAAPEHSAKAITPADACAAFLRKYQDDVALCFAPDAIFRSPKFQGILHESFSRDDVIVAHMVGVNEAQMLDYLSLISSVQMRWPERDKSSIKKNVRVHLSKTGTVVDGRTFESLSRAAAYVAYVGALQLEIDADDNLDYAEYLRFVDRLPSGIKLLNK